MSWDQEFIEAFERVATPMAYLRGVAAPPADLSPATLASAYNRVVRPDQTPLHVATSIKGAMESAARDADRDWAQALWGLEAAIVAAQKRATPATADEAGGILLPDDFQKKVALSHPDYGQPPNGESCYTLGSINSLRDGHWCRDALNSDDWVACDGGPCIFLGKAQILHIAEAIRVTKRLRAIQREQENAYRRQEEQEAERARRAWELSPEGRIQSLESSNRELQKQVQELLARVSA